MKPTNMREKQVNIRFSLSELEEIRAVAADVGVKSGAWLRMIALEAIKSHNRHHEELVSRLDAIDSRLASIDALSRGNAKLSDGAFSMACASVGLLASRNLDAIDGSDATVFRDRLRENMRVGVAIGDQLRANLSSGKSI